MPNYANGKIYKIVNDINDEIYVGSTVQPTLAKRMALHRSRCRTYARQNKLYRRMHEVGLDHFSIVLLEIVNCNSKDELCAREQHWMEQLKPTLNERMALLDDETKKEKAVECRIQYYSNPEKTARRKENNLKYFAENKDRLLQLAKEKVQCDICNALISRHGLKSHKENTVRCKAAANIEPIAQLH